MSPSARVFRQRKLVFVNRPLRLEGTRCGGAAFHNDYWLGGWIAASLEATKKQKSTFVLSYHWGPIILFRYRCSTTTTSTTLVPVLQLVLVPQLVLVLLALLVLLVVLLALLVLLVTTSGGSGSNY